MRLPAFRWFSTRWVEFRHGYTTYVAFILGFANFALIAYNFVPEIKEHVPIWAFIPGVLFSIIPFSIFVGRWHHRQHLPNETVIMAKRNYYRDKIVPDSKEVFGARYAVFTTQFMDFQMRMLRKQMVAINEIKEKMMLDPAFSDMEIDMTDWKAQECAKWGNLHVEYMSGKDASTLV